MKGVEAEIKLLASPAMLEKLRQLPLLAGEEHAAELVTRYFDTPDGRLHRARASLRMRESDGQREQTFKQPEKPGGKHAQKPGGKDRSAVRREEWTAALAGDRPDPAAFAPRAEAALARLLDGQEPAEFAAVKVQRRRRNVRHGASLIEVAFDTGEIEAAGRHAPICECELELVEGRLADVLALARELPLGTDLRWSVTAKGDRAFALAHDETPGAVHARKIVLRPAMSIADAFRTIGWGCLDHLLSNYGVLIASADNDALHQCRVAIRRLRAALSLFAGSVESDTATRFREAFGSAATALGEAREVHVLLQALARAAPGPADAAASELIPDLVARRDAALAAASAQLGGAGFQQLLFDFARWIESADRKDAGPETLPAFTARVLDHHRSRVKHAGRHLHAMTDHDLHRLRIKVKKLRYAVEFFSCLAAPEALKAADEYADVLGKLQDRLGALHDLSEQTADGPLFAGYEPARAQRLEDEIRRRLGNPGAAREELVEASARALKKLLALPRWWQAADRETDMAHDKHGHAGNDKQLRELQIRLTGLQRHVIAKGAKLLVIFEGRDTAGKDGTIKRIVEHLSPRDTRVVALGTPSDHDRKAWYFQRYCAQLPVSGEIALFNRSWYNRAGVERVMGFCTDAEYEQFMSSVVQFEQLLVDAGITIVKYYLDISRHEQKQRLRDRTRDPLKQWKISPIDKQALKNWDKYSKARNAMLARTHSVFAPWVVVKADDKPQAHLAVIRDLLMRGGEHVDAADLPDPAIAFVYDAQALAKGWLAE